MTNAIDGGVCGAGGFPGSYWPALSIPVLARLGFCTVECRLEGGILLDRMDSLHTRLGLLFPLGVMGLLALMEAGFFLWIQRSLTRFPSLDESVRGEIAQVALQGLGAMLAVSLLVTLVWLIHLRTRGFLFQLRLIAKSIQRISEGKVSAIELDRHVAAEFDEICSSINEMVKRLAISQSRLEQKGQLLKQSKDELEERVETRTRELEEKKSILESKQHELISVNEQMAIKARSLEEKTRRQQDYSSFLSGTTSIEIDEIFTNCLERIVEVCHFHFVMAWLWDEAADDLRPVYQYVMGHGRMDDGFIQGSRHMVEKILQSGTWLEVEKFSEETIPEVDLGVMKIRLSNLYGIPISLHQKKLGVLLLGGVQDLTKDSRQFLKDCIPPLATALSNALSYRLIHVQTENLKEVNAKLEVAGRLKDQFLANVSHEIRTPLNGIVGMANLLYETTLLPEQKDFLKVIKASSDTLCRLINDLLDLSKIEAGQMELEEEPFHLLGLVEQVLDAVVVGPRDLELYYSVSPGCRCQYLGDASRLRQVLTNLVGNSVKFTSQGEIEVALKLLAPGDGTDLVQFQVRDTGIGIAKESLDTIFDSFVQADGSISREYGGTGLGTTISRQIVHLMGGEISVESELGTGTVFTFHVPLKRDTRNAETCPILNFEEAKRPVLLGEGRHIESLAGYLRGIGLPVEEFVDQHKALEWAEQLGDKLRRYCFFLDWRVGKARFVKMIGWLLAKNHSAEGIIALIPLGQMELISEAGNVGIGHLTKPVKFQQVARLLGGTAVLADSRKQQSPIKDLVLSTPMTVLLAEDNKVNQKVALTYLKSPVWEVSLAQTGLEVLKNFREKPYDLILMDVQMPEMDGLEATRSVRAMEQFGRRVPIIAMTAHAMKGDRDRCIEAGMDDYVTKPLDAEKLFEAIYRNCERVIAGRSRQRLEQSQEENMGRPVKTVAKAPTKSKEQTVTVKKRIPEDEVMIPVDEGFVAVEAPVPAKSTRFDARVFDFDKAMSVAGKDLDLVVQLLEIFAQDFPEQKENLEIAIENEDWVAVAAEAHGVKGSALSIGAAKVAEYCFSLEKGAKQETLDLAKARQLLELLFGAVLEFQRETSSLYKPGK